MPTLPVRSLFIWHEPERRMNHAATTLLLTIIPATAALADSRYSSSLYLQDSPTPEETIATAAPIYGDPDHWWWTLGTGVGTTLRPDILIYSNSMKIIIWGELTVPLEENIGAAAIRKRNRYSVSTKSKLSLADQCRRNEWTVHDYTIEVGAMG